MDFKRVDGQIYCLDENGRRIAEIDFPLIRPGVVHFDHTYVDASLRGQGVADRLIRAAVDELREKGLKARTSCSFAARWFYAHPECADLLAEEEAGCRPSD